MPEPEKPENNQIADKNLNSEQTSGGEKDDYKFNLNLGGNVNKLFIFGEDLKKLRALKEEEELLKELIKSQQELLDLEEEEELLKKLLKSESEEKHKKASAETSLSTDETEKSTLLEKVKDVFGHGKGFRKVLANVLSVTFLASVPIHASAPDADSPAARSESMQMYSNANQVKGTIMPDVLLGDPNLTMYESSNFSSAESEQGIKNGYGEKGMWLSENKSGRFSFGNAAEVAEVCNNDPKEMAYYTISNEPEAFASYISFTPDEYRREDFRGLSDAAIEKKIEGLSGAEYQDLLEHYRKNVLDASVFEDAVLNGKYRTHYINYLGESGANPTHENMGLFRCNVNRNHQKASAFRLPNGKSILVNMSAIRDEQGKITGFRPEGCLQPQEVIAVSYDSKKDEFKVISYDQSQDNYEIAIIPANIAEAPTENQAEISAKASIGPSGDESTEEQKDPTDSEPDGPSRRGGGYNTKQWGKKGDPHGGIKAYSDLVNPESKITKEENDQTNQDDQGHEDDNQAATGDPSEANGTAGTGFAESGNIASGASTSEGRPLGGSNQAMTVTGGSKMAAENAYRNDATIKQGQAVDASGGHAQGTAQTTTVTGGDNYDNAGEAQAAKGENF